MNPISNFAMIPGSSTATPETASRPTSNGPSASTDTQRDRVLAAFLRRMASAYHESWTAKVRTDKDFQRVSQDYGRILAGLSMDEIKGGIERAERQCKFPPSPAEFLQLAKAGAMDGTNGAAYRVLPKALPAPRNLDAGRQALEQIRATVRRRAA